MAQVPELYEEFVSLQWFGRFRGQCAMLTGHDVGGDNSVRRPAVLCCLARIGSNCDNECEYPILEQGK